jgi:multidrug resistance efflux pump
MKRRLITLAVLAVLIAAGVIIYAAYQRHLAHQPLEWSGTVEARTIEVGSKVGGRVKEVLAREGEMVKAGQPLIVLETGDLEAQKLQAEGQLEQAEANLSKVSDRTGSARRQEIAAARARLQAQVVAVEKADLDLARTRKLFAGGAATRTDLDNAEIALRNATAQRDALQAQLDEVMQGTPQDVKAFQGQVDVAKGRLDQIDTMISELTVRAPRDARVETLDLRPGDIIAPNAVAAKLLEPDQLYVRIYVPETELGHVHPGQEVPVFVDSFPHRAFKATVESVSEEGEFTPRNLQTVDERADQVFASRLRLDEGRDVLRAGMAAIAEVPR